MKKILTLLLFLTASIMFGQEIKIKKGIVTIDGKECLKIDDADPNNVSIFDMEGNEIIFLKYIHDSKYASLYNKIIFLDQKRSFTSRNYIYTQKLLVKRLIGEKLLSDCKLDESKLDKFILKFDENVEVD